MIQQDLIPDMPLLTASADGSALAPGGTSVHRVATPLAWVLWALTLLLVIGRIPLRYQWHAVASALVTTLRPMISQR